MIKKLLSLFLLLLSVSSWAQDVVIPDANFKAYLVGNTSINTNSDGEIQLNEATAFTGSIVCFNMNIADLTGIEAFTNITSLNCYGNQLSTLNVSNNTNLEYLRCADNLLTSLDLSTNTSLGIVMCENNQLTELDLSALNQLTILVCNNNALTSLNVANGNNVSVVEFRTDGNPDLGCIQVDDPIYSEDHWYTWGAFAVDEGVVYSLNCSVGTCIVDIPNYTLKFMLVNNAAVNTNQNTEIECEEAAAYTGSLAFSLMQINDFTGIEAFVNLTGFDCSYNPITNINLSSNTALINLYCHYTSLGELDLNGLSALEEVQATGTGLTTLDITGCESLRILSCDYNNLTSLDLSGLSLLESLQAGNNFSLESLDLRNGNNANISQLSVSNTPLLTCIEVDDASWSTANWIGALNFYFDNSDVFSEDCSNGGLNAPSNLLASVNEELVEITLEWIDNASSEIAFSIERSSNGVDFEEIYVVPANSSSYEDGNIQVDITYSYRVRAFNDSGFSDYSNIVQAGIISNAVGEGVENVIQLYPNPTMGQLTISSKQATSISVYDVFGKKHISRRIAIGANILNLESLPAGIYFIQNGEGLNVSFIKE